MAGILLGLVLYLPAAWAAAGGQSPAASGLTPVRLQLKWKHQFQFAGYYAAIAQGYYRAAGLAVTLIELPEGSDPVSEVMAGRAEYGVSASELLLHRAQGQPVVALAAIFQHSPLVLLASARLNNVHALAGRRIALLPHEAELLAYLARESIASWQMVPHQPDKLVDLQNGRIDAVSGYSTNEPFLLQQAGFPYTVLMPRAAGIDFYGDTLFTREEQLLRAPEQVRAFRAASLQGWAYAMQHPDEIIRLIHAQYNPGRSIAHLQFEAGQMRELVQNPLVAMGHMYRGRWQHIADIYHELGWPTAHVDLGHFLYDPNPPPPDLSALYTVLAVTAGICLIVFLVAMYVIRLNRYLTSSEKRFRTVFDAVPVALIVSDLEGHIIDWNHGSADIFGWSHEEAIGQDMYELLVPVQSRETVRATVQQVLSHIGPTHSLNRNLTRDGRLIVCDWSNAPFHDKNDRVSGIISLGIDVTAREQLQARLREAKEIAEQALSDQRQFMAMVSHEFRSPLAVIDSSVQVLASRTANQSGLERLIQRIRRGIRRMTTFLENYLTHDRFDSSGWEIQPENIELLPFLETLVEQTQALSGGRHEILLDSDELPRHCQADARLLAVLIQNLLDNAVKYSPKGGEILLHGCFDEQENALCLSVSDSGIGIAAAEQERIFSRYYRSSKVGNISGAGLGLTLVKRIIELHGGWLMLDSTPGQGSRFSVFLPQPLPPSVYHRSVEAK